MNNNLLKDRNGLPHLLQQVLQKALGYLEGIDQAVTGTSLPFLQQDILPASGLGAEKALQQFILQYQPIMVASAGPRYFGFVTGGTTPAALAGDWLTGVYDQNPQGTVGPGDISASIELSCISMLLDLLGLPSENFNGGFVSGATMSNFTGLAVGRQWAGAQQGLDIAREGMAAASLTVLGATAHSSAVKALSMLGLGSASLVSLPIQAGREALELSALESWLEAHPGRPTLLISSAGTVNTVDFDDLAAIAALKKRYSFWWHIDAAFGGFAACSPQYRSLLQGWEEADSITVDGHKWLNVPYDSAVIFTRKEHAVLQTRTFQNSNAPYLGDPQKNFSFLNFLPENSRRFRALPAWFTLMAYGREGYRDIVENNIRLAARLGEKIAASPHFELASPVRLNTVCFSLAGQAANPGRVRDFIHLLNGRGRIFLTPTFYQGKNCLRAAMVNWRTTPEDIELTFTELEAVNKMLK